MGPVLLRATALGCIIMIGIIVRGVRLVPKEAGMITRNLMFYVTMPAALITNFAKLQEMNGQMLWAAFFGVFGNVMMLLVAIALTRKSPKAKQALYMLCLPGYGVGAFTLSFVQSFLPAVGNVAVCFFDMGNCVLCSGLCYAITAEYISEKKRGINFKVIIRRLLTSAPLMAGVFMTVLLLLNLHLPAFVLTLLEPIANANPFVSMIMLGLFFHMEMKWEYLLEITEIIGLRTLFAVPLALFCYFCLPFDLVIRQALVLVSFAPTTVNAPGFVALCKGDDGLASAASSVSILFSLVVSIALLALLGLA